MKKGKIKSGKGLLAHIESLPKQEILFSTNYTDAEYKKMFDEIVNGFEGRDRSGFIKRQEQQAADILARYKELFPDEQ